MNPLSQEFCAAWARVFRDFLRACTDAYGTKDNVRDGVTHPSVCVHCASGSEDTAGGSPRLAGPVVTAVPEPVRRRIRETIARVGEAPVDFAWDAFCLRYEEAHDQEVVLRVRARLGARCGVPLSLPPSSPASPENFRFSREQPVNRVRQRAVSLPGKGPVKEPLVSYEVPADIARDLERVLDTIEWPTSVRKYVAGKGECIGLMSSRDDEPKVHFWNVDTERFARVFNKVIRRLLCLLAIEFVWTSLQINLNTVADWHVDFKNAGPSFIFALGAHLGGEFEVEGQPPMSLRNRIVFFDGQCRHRSHPFEGVRYSVVGFANESLGRCTWRQKQILAQAGFVCVRPAPCGACGRMTDSQFDCTVCEQRTCTSCIYVDQVQCIRCYVCSLQSSDEGERDPRDGAVGNSRRPLPRGDPSQSAEAIASAGSAQAALRAPGSPEGPTKVQKSCSVGEAVRKGSHHSYKNKDKKERQDELFPKLCAEIEERRAARKARKVWGGERRFGEEYRAELAKQVANLIGGTPEDVLVNNAANDQRHTIEEVTRGVSGTSRWR